MLNSSYEKMLLFVQVCKLIMVPYVVLTLVNLFTVLLLV